MPRCVRTMVLLLLWLLFKQTYIYILYIYIVYIYIIIVVFLSLLGLRMVDGSNVLDGPSHLLVGGECMLRHARFKWDMLFFGTRIIHAVLFVRTFEPPD